MVTNGMSVRSSSGSFGFAAACSAAASTSGGNSGDSSSSASIARTGSAKVARQLLPSVGAANPDAASRHVGSVRSLARLSYP